MRVVLLAVVMTVAALLLTERRTERQLVARLREVGL